MVKPPLDFIHQKEIDVVLRWLSTFPIVTGSRELVDSPGAHPQVLASQQVLSRVVPNDNVVSTLLNRKATMFSNRIDSLDAM